MKIMISQPMRNKTVQQIREERAELVKQLEEDGHEIIETIFEDFSEDKSAIYYLAKSIEMLDKADAVIFMSDWKNFRGCRIEYEVAKSYGKVIMFL